jgi:hypothetical protein
LPNTINAPVQFVSKGPWVVELETIVI